MPTPAFEILASGARPTLTVPFVVKAPREGSSVGVYIVRTEGEIESSLAEARKYSSELLVEQFVEGRELTVGIVGDVALPVIEIVAKKDFYNFENKYPFLNPNAAGARTIFVRRKSGSGRRRSCSRQRSRRIARSISKFIPASMCCSRNPASRSCWRSTRFPA